MRGSKRIVRDTPIDTHRQLTPLVMQKKLLMLSALMVALACAHAGETPEVTNKVRRAPTRARVGIVVGQLDRVTSLD